MKDRDVLPWLVLVLVAVVVGQWLFARTLALFPSDNPPWTAVLIVAVGALGLWIGSSRGRPEDAQEAVTPAPPEVTPTWLQVARPLAVGAGLVLTIVLLWRIPALTPGDSYLLVTWLWALALVLVLLAAMPWPVTWDWRSYWRDRRRLILIVMGVTAAALLLRVWRLDTIPFVLGGDEASQGLEAIRVLNGELRNPFATGWLGVPTMSFFFNSLSIDWLGRTVVALRLPWALVGTATVFITFVLVKQMQGVRLALMAATLVALYHYHIHFSRLGSNQIADPFFLSLALLFLYWALRGGRRLDWALTGIVAGLAFYFYAGARLTPVVLLAVIAYLFVLGPRRFVERYAGGVLAAAFAFLIAAAPMVQYALRFPGEFNARLNEVGIIQSGWLEREVVIRAEPAATILFDQFRRAALAFHYYPDRTVWYGLPQPLFNPWFGTLFLLGLFYGTMQLFDRRRGPWAAGMVAWWWGGMLLGGMFTESPPSSQRLITLAVPACFFLGYALWEVIHLADQALRRVPVNALLALGVVWFGLSSLNTYFLEFTPLRLYGGRNAEMATQIAPQLEEWKYNHRFHFVGAPWMYWGFATLPYLVEGAEAGDILEPLTAPPPPEQLGMPGKGLVFIVLPPRMAELPQIEAAFPAGERQDVFSPVDGRHMVTLYRVPPWDVPPPFGDG